MLAQVKDVAQIGAALATIAAAASAGYWFFFLRSFRNRIELDCQLRIFDVGPERPYLAELVVALDNKGQREHRLYNLWCEVREPGRLSKSGNRKSYLRQTNLVQEGNYMFVAAGVRQLFPITLDIPREASVVEARALFVHEERNIRLDGEERVSIGTLNRRGLTPHWISRLFPVVPTAAR